LISKGYSNQSMHGAKHIRLLQSGKAVEMQMTIPIPQEQVSVLLATTTQRAFAEGRKEGYKQGIEDCLWGAVKDFKTEEGIMAAIAVHTEAQGISLGDFVDRLIDVTEDMEEDESDTQGPILDTPSYDDDEHFDARGNRRGNHESRR
jgi:hypothetical protein